ncbi:hypothetical protein GCM10010435_66060 [Winogradskya consettensis]|uniref:Uncharacterized protein n=1 Tax=Winogradskya consettensis TaxID=113560 RepID=A0A919T4U5_9ACTN|nr:hypothetical protein [Actinoplanes consettensis]GIM84761.1 hypothetical protein Aco04nite_93020 [Actinoplanes consettensis]
MSSAVEVLALFELPEPEPQRPPEDAVVAALRDTGPVNEAVAGAMGWLTGLLAPTVPPVCVRCGTEHVYRAPAGFVMACPACFPGEVTA